MTNEAFSRVRIDAQLKDQGWGLPHAASASTGSYSPVRSEATDGGSAAVGNANAVRFEYVRRDTDCLLRY